MDHALLVLTSLPIAEDALSKEMNGNVLSVLEQFLDIKFTIEKITQLNSSATASLRNL
jgi:hypothetical protein